MTEQEFTDSMVKSATEYLEAKGVLNTIRAQAIEDMLGTIKWSNFERSIKNQIQDYLDTLK